MKQPESETVEFIVRELSRYHPENAIIRQLCERNGWKWQQAADLVERLKVEHEQEIHAARRRVWLAAGGILCLAGIGWTLVSALSWLRGELSPVELDVLWFAPTLLPHGGQLIGVVIGLAIVGIGGACLVQGNMAHTERG